MDNVDHVKKRDVYSEKIYSCLNPLPDNKILDWSKSETICRRHFKVHLK